MYTINYKIRSILYQASLPRQFWCFAAEYSSWIKNRIPTAALLFGESQNRLSQAVTLFEAYHKKLPDLVRLRVFGCSAWLNIPKGKQPHKLDPRIKSNYLIISIKSHQIYRLYNIITRKVNKYTNVDFNKYSFLYT